MTSAEMFTARRSTPSRDTSVMRAGVAATSRFRRFCVDGGSPIVGTDMWKRYLAGTCHVCERSFRWPSPFLHTQFVSLRSRSDVACFLFTPRIREGGDGET